MPHFYSCTQTAQETIHVFLELLDIYDLAAIFRFIYSYNMCNEGVEMQEYYNVKQR